MVDGLASRVDAANAQRFYVFQRNGHILQKGDVFTVTRPNGDVTTYTFISCTHPRKVYVEVTSEDKGWKQEYYANVLEVAIWDNIHNEWTFPLS